MKISVEIDGDKLVAWFREKESTAVIDTGDTYLVTAPIRDILDGAIENMRILFDDDDDLEDVQLAIEEFFENDD